MKQKRRTLDIADLLRHHVSPSVSMSRGGRFSFQLLCSVPWCYRQDTVSASQRTIGSEAHRLEACRKFAAHGWLVIENAPVCPDCRKAQEADLLTRRPGDRRGSVHGGRSSSPQGGNRSERR